MPILRFATTEDVALIASHRHQMFHDNNFSTEERLEEMDRMFEPWVRTRLEDGRYVGLFLEEDGQVLAGAGIYFGDFPPHWMDPRPGRAYLLNFYSTPEARGRGYANQLLRESVEECRKRGSTVVVLHASPFGRPIYEKFGFTASSEMMLRLDA
jgi:GNAT superfamily N-acetyltransferase